MLEVSPKATLEWEHKKIINLSKNEIMSILPTHTMSNSLSAAACATLLLSAPNTSKEGDGITNQSLDSRNWKPSFTHCLGDFPGIPATTRGLCGIGLQSPHWDTKGLLRPVLPHTRGIHDTAPSDSLDVSLCLPSPKQVSPHPPGSWSWIYSIFRGQTNPRQWVPAPLPINSISTFCRGQSRHDCPTGTHACTHSHIDCKGTAFLAMLAAPTPALTGLLPGSLLPKYTHLHAPSQGCPAAVFLVSGHKNLKWSWWLYDKKKFPPDFSWWLA